MGIKILLIISVFININAGAVFAASLDTSLLNSADYLMYEAVPGESEVGFFAKSTTHNFSGATKDISGFLKGVPLKIEQTAASVITINASVLKTGIAVRDNWMRKDLDVAGFPNIKFELSGIKIVEQDINSLTAKLLLSGTLDLHGVKKQLTIPARVKIKDDRVIFEGETQISMSDYNIKPHGFLFLKVHNEVLVRFMIVGRKKNG